MFLLKGSKVGKIRTESGVWIPATYKSNRYAQWKERTKVGENESEEENSTPKGTCRFYSHNFHMNFNKTLKKI